MAELPHSESEWKPGLKEYFTYAHALDKSTNTATMKQREPDEYMRVDYRFYLFWKYAEKYAREREKDDTELMLRPIVRM